MNDPARERANRDIAKRGVFSQPDEKQPSMGSALQERAQRATRSCSSFFLPWWAHRKLSVAGWGGLRRGVSRMDAATELTGTYLQRPLRGPPHPAKHGF